MEDIFNYLVSKKYQKNIIWPKYKKDAKKHNDNLKNNGISIIKDKIKDNEIRKRGRNSQPVEYSIYEYINVKNLKTQFRASASKYKLTDDGKGLIYKTKIYFINEKTNLKETKIEYNLVPKIVELNEKLFDYHYNEKDLIKIFKNNNINFYGLQTIIQEYVKSCPSCLCSKYENITL